MLRSQPAGRTLGDLAESLSTHRISLKQAASLTLEQGCRQQVIVLSLTSSAMGIQVQMQPHPALYVDVGI